jgi:hypothetical protein
VRPSGRLALPRGCHFDTAGRDHRAYCLRAQLRTPSFNGGVLVRVRQRVGALTSSQVVVEYTVADWLSPESSLTDRRDAVGLRLRRIEGLGSDAVFPWEFGGRRMQMMQRHSRNRVTMTTYRQGARRDSNQTRVQYPHRTAQMVDDPLSVSERALIETAISLTSGFDVQSICGSVLDAVERLYEARASWILLHDPDTDELATCAFRGPGADAYAAARVPTKQGIVGIAF